MPLVRIDLNKNSSRKLRKTISEVVYSVMTEVANVPEHDKFQIFTVHEFDELVYPREGYLGIEYTQDIIFIRVIWVSGRTTDMKKAFFRRICDDLHARAGVRKEDVWIAHIDADRTGWSFGKGEMQYEPKSHP